MTDRISRRQVLQLGIAAPVLMALSALHVPAPLEPPPASSPSTPRPPLQDMAPSRKKGVGVATKASQAAYRVQSMNPAWYYTWAAGGIPGLQGVEFVPMVWGGTDIQTQINDVKALGPGKQPFVLGPNEPDNPKQSNMSVAEVLKWWPQISDLAALTVAPAPLHPFTPDEWLPDFVQQAAELGLRYNYMALHHYPSPDAAGFLSTVDRVYETYGLPVWITEFAVADWNASPTKPNIYPAGQVLEFMEAVLPELDRRPHVARYSWFGAGPDAATTPALETSTLFDKSGQMTKLGEFYAQFGATAASPAQAGGVIFR